MLPGNFLQRADLLIHVKALRIAVVQDVIGQHPQASGNGLRVPADHRLGMAALYQFLYFFGLVQADGDMFLQIQRHLKRPQQALVVIALVRRQHMHLLVALGDQVHHLLLAREQRRQ